VREKRTREEGIVVTAGAEVSEVKFDAGHSQFITNQYLERVRDADAGDR
jgi:hypothetical protein